MVQIGDWQRVFVAPLVVTFVAPLLAQKQSLPYNLNNLIL
jgi:hypothetical protein